MDIEKQFDFLVTDYGLKHAYQDFNNCFGGHWWVCTHSYYNESGCFTIHNLPQRGELDFYYAKEFSNIRKDLCEQRINISAIGTEIWEKNEKFLFMKNPFFWWSEKKVLKSLAEVIEAEIKSTGQFFGIKVTKDN